MVLDDFIRQKSNATYPEPPRRCAPRLILLLFLLVGIVLLTLAEARIPYLSGDLTLAPSIQTLGPISNTLVSGLQGRPSHPGPSFSLASRFLVRGRSAVGGPPQNVSHSED
jgi:hypothetical protein